MFCIVQRETIGILRQRRSLIMLGIGLVILSGAFIFAWRSFLLMPGGILPRDAGRNVFMSMAFIQLLFLLGLGGVASESISRERERETWDLLQSAPLGPWRILLGKVFSSLLFMLLSYLALLPILALCFPLGGLSPHELIGTCTILFGSMVLVTLVGTFCSSLTRRSMIAVWTTMLFLFAYCLLLPHALVALLDGYLRLSLFRAYPMELVFSPVLSLYLLFNPSLGPGAPSSLNWMRTEPHLIFLVPTAIVCLLLLVVTARRIGETEKTAPLFDEISRRGWRRSIRKPRRRLIGDGANSVWIKERMMRGARWVPFLVIVRAGLIVSGVLTATFFGGFSRPFWTAQVAMVILAVVCILSSVTPTAAIVGERSRKTWDLLRVTPLRSTTILFGKMLAVSEHILLLVVYFFLGLYVTWTLLNPRMLIIGFNPVEKASYLVLILSCLVFYVSIGIFFSARAKSMATAYLSTFGCVFVHAAGAFLFMWSVDKVLLYCILVVVCVTVYIAAVLIRSRRTESPATLGSSSLRMILLGVGGAILIESLDMLFFSDNSPGAAWTKLSHIPPFFTPFGLLMNNPWSGDHRWYMSVPIWTILLFLHCGMLLLISSFLIRAASRRISRPEE
ncbi:MAG: ABC transporter permease [bacterium]